MCAYIISKCTQTVYTVGICEIICFMHYFACIWTPVIAFNCKCVQMCVYVKAYVCLYVHVGILSHGRFETNGSGSLHTHILALLMPAYCIVHCVCSDARVFLPVCMPWQCVILCSDWD